MNKAPSRRHAKCRAITVLALLVAGGCTESDPAPAPVAKAPPVAAAVDTAPVLSADELRRRLGTDERARFRREGTSITEVYLAGAGVQSIEPLRGLPLKVLDLGFCANIDDISVVEGMPLKTLILEGTSVSDLSPIRDMALETLHLQDTPVTDLTPIHGMPLRQLNLKGVAISDVTPFAEMPLSILWLLETDVSDISALSGLTLESLDLQDTAVSDLTALAHMTSLRRLNIAGTPIRDIRPVTGLRLERLFLSPERITHGMNELRQNSTLETVGTSHETNFSADSFWERFDGGAWAVDFEFEKTDKSPPSDVSETTANESEPAADTSLSSEPAQSDSDDSASPERDETDPAPSAPGDNE